MMNITPVVKQLLIVNIIFFAGSQLIGDSAYDLLAMHYFSFEKFKIWQPITHIFMHGDIMHIAFNMFALYSFGSTLEAFWGGKKFSFFYISCGLGAVAFHTAIDYFQIQNIFDGVASLNLSHSEMQQILNIDMKTAFNYKDQLAVENIKSIMETTKCTQDQFNSLMSASMKFQATLVGASGAIYGLLVAFAFMFPNAELMMIFLPIPIKAKYFVPLILVGDLYLGVTGKSIFGGSSGIAHFAHIGGALLGFIIMWYWKKSSFNNKRWN